MSRASFMLSACVLALPGLGFAQLPRLDAVTATPIILSTDGQRQNLLRLIEVEQGLRRILQVLHGPSTPVKIEGEPLEAAQRPNDAPPSEAQVERDSLAALVRINQDLQAVLATLASPPGSRQCGMVAPFAPTFRSLRAAESFRGKTYGT